MAITLGIPVSQGALLLGYFSVSAIFGKLLSGRLADLPRVRRLYIFIFSAVILSVSSMCVTAAKSYHGLLAYTLVAGFFDGCFVVTVPLITQDIVGKELMAKAIGTLYGVVAFPLTLGPPLLGKAYFFRQFLLGQLFSRGKGAMRLIKPMGSTKPRDETRTACPILFGLV